MQTKSYKQCQSCGMPLKMDKLGGGSEKDGSLSKMYCSSCYENGAFKRPDLTVEGMKELVENALKNEVHASRIFIRLAKMQIPRLARWRK